MTVVKRILRVALAVSLGAALWMPLAAAPMKVKGLGWWDNRGAQRTLELLLGKKSTDSWQAWEIEDAALILLSELESDGFLRPRLTAEVTPLEGEPQSYVLDRTLTQLIPRPLEATSVTLVVEQGQRFHFDEVNFEGLSGVGEEEARSFFIGQAAPLLLKAERIYSPARLRRGVGNLTETLHRRGYANATVESSTPVMDEKSGAVTVTINVKPGPRWMVRSVRLVPEQGEGPPEGIIEALEQPWSTLWRQDAAATIRRWYYERGYPDVQVQIDAEARPETDGVRQVDVVARIRPGELIKLGEIGVRGNARTRESVIRRAIRSAPGDPFNPIEFDDAQSRIARLGVFEAVDSRYVPHTDGTRDVVFEVREGRRQEVNLLAGYGSYEELRGGVEWRHYNLFGRAHSSTLRLVQSMKSSRGEYDYAVPQLFGGRADGSARLFGLRREERSFDREEVGASVALLWPLRRWDANLSTGYTFRRLRNMDNQLATGGTDSEQENAASVEVGIVRDRRDNPMYPRRGYKVSLQLQEASRGLGGEVDYQQLQFGASYHRGLGRGLFFHVGFTHAVVGTLGARSDAALPVNVQFFPGGENSIRGYHEGEAAPRTDEGKFVGARTYSLLNIELEQALTTKWSVVLFSDSLAQSSRLATYPSDEELFSVGLGIRYRTLIGPVRVEYGRNLNPRTHDPSGTVQISIGYPF